MLFFFGVEEADGNVWLDDKEAKIQILVSANIARICGQVVKGNLLLFPEWEQERPVDRSDSTSFRRR